MFFLAALETPAAAASEGPGGAILCFLLFFCTPALVDVAGLLLFIDSFWKDFKRSALASGLLAEVAPAASAAHGACS